MTLQFNQVEYIKEATCKGQESNCSCLKILKNYIIQKIDGNINHPLEKKITYKENGGIVFNGCGKADQIIGVTIQQLNDINTQTSNKSEDSIKDNKQDLIKYVKKFREENNNDIHLQATNTTRHQNINRLDITFKRGLSQEQKQKLIIEYEKKSL